MMHLISLADTEKDLFQVIAGWIGNALALFFFFSPALVIYKLMKKEIEAKTIPYVLFLANLMNCLLWFIYGYRKEDNQVYIGNGIGCSITLIYLIVYWYYFVNNKILHYLGLMLATLVVMAGVFSACMFWVSNNEITGYVAMVFNIIMYAAPGQKIIELCKTGDYNLIPILSSVIGFLCSLSWLIYGIYDHNIPIITPNGLGIIFCIIQINCWIYFYRKAKNQTPELQAFMEHKDEPTTKV